MSRPGDDERENLKRSRLEALKFRLLRKLTTQARKSKTSGIVAEMRPGEYSKLPIGDTRGVAVALLKTEIDGSAGCQDKQIEIARRPERRGCEFYQNVDCRDRCRVIHRMQLNEVLDRAPPELGPDSLVFAACFLHCRMRRPVDPQCSEIVETDGYGAVGLINGHV